jgi:hypothetical protein
MNRPDKFQDTLVEVAIGIIVMFAIATIVSTGVNAIKTLDADAGINPPSAWQGK